MKRLPQGKDAEIEAWKRTAARCAEHGIPKGCAADPSVCIAWRLGTCQEETPEDESCGESIARAIYREEDV